jgi:hypothetical protein
MVLLFRVCAGLLGIVYLGISMSSCSSPTSISIESPVPASVPTVVTPATATPATGNGNTALWTGELSDPNWMSTWHTQQEGSWGLQNLQVIADPSHRFSQVIRVRYPAGSASPSASRRQNAPMGGAQFYADLGIAPQNALRLSYDIRFSDNFNFVKGGKLPGLFGGAGNSGGDIPNGSDGFSARLMWRRHGDGEVYAYLPTSHDYGTSIGRGSWQFQPGVWHHIEQEVLLNHPGLQDGRIRVWFDGRQVLTVDNLTFRTTSTLQINGLFFSTFFGGNDSSWATPEDVYIDFANFSVAAVNML